MPTQRRLRARRSHLGTPDTDPRTWPTILGTRLRVYLASLHRVLTSSRAVVLAASGDSMLPRAAAIMVTINPVPAPITFAMRCTSGVSPSQLRSKAIATAVPGSAASVAADALGQMIDRTDTDGLILLDLRPPDPAARPEPFVAPDVAGTVRERRGADVRTFRVPDLTAHHDWLDLQTLTRTGELTSTGKGTDLPGADAVITQAGWVAELFGAQVDYRLPVNVRRSEHLQVFTDGSVRDDVAAAAGVVAHGARQVAVATVRRDAPPASLDAEVLGIATAVAVFSTRTHSLKISTDSKAAIGLAQETHPRENAAVEHLRVCLRSVLTDARARGVEVVLGWSEGHAGVHGNEMADRLAGMARRWRARGRSSNDLVAQL
ncbi:RNase H family protein [Corynebacterium sp. AOP12-C2-36]|uniref:RNase H family protein n=1 Tax=Corynebacterium sp. AOP12-C2-36 TaxID=3457723 RepID=UPI00403417A1